jgi:hypothetical protein
MATDAERLNFVARVGGHFTYSHSMNLTLGPDDGLAGGKLTEDPVQVGFATPERDDYGYHIYDAPTIREAIDKAMADPVNAGGSVPPNHRCFAPAPRDGRDG